LGKDATAAADGLGVGERGRGKSISMTRATNYQVVGW
jgi:hypothetical protein